jgi:hypothetical protein
LRAGRFKQEQENAHSEWNTIVHRFEKRYDKPGYLARCSRDLPNNWGMGKPLVQAAIAKADFQAAEQWLIKTFASYRRRLTGKREDWLPESSLLLIDARWIQDRSEMNQASELLSTWGMVGLKLGNDDRARAAHFQAAVMRDAEELQDLIDHFKRLREGRHSESLEKLFGQWQDEIARRSVSSHYGEAERKQNDTWTHWALTASAEGTAEAFRKKLDAWLERLQSTGKEFSAQWRALACLTVDLIGAADLKRTSPALAATALKGFMPKTALGDSRSTIAKNLCKSQTVDILMNIWKEQFVLIVPEPAGAGGHYEDSVSWAKALQALNPEAYTRLLRDWSSRHRRRRNLWEQFRKAGLTVE